MGSARLRMAVLVLAVAFPACSEDESPTTVPVYITQYDQVHDWNCAQSVSCQDVYNIRFTAHTVAGFAATDLTGDSIVQLALYAPGVPLGGINLLTGTTSELRCNYVDGDDCSSRPDGEMVEEYPVDMGGVYRLAVTRDWGASCGGNGTYRLLIVADNRFEFPVRTANDVATKATGYQCLITR